MNRRKISKALIMPLILWGAVSFSPNSYSAGERVSELVKLYDRGAPSARVAPAAGTGTTRPAAAIESEEDGAIRRRTEVLGAPEESAQPEEVILTERSVETPPASGILGNPVEEPAEVGGAVWNDNMLDELPSPDDVLNGDDVSSTHRKNKRPESRIAVAAAGVKNLQVDEKKAKLNELVKETSKKIDDGFENNNASDLVKLIQEFDTHSGLGSRLKSLFQCSADLIESGYAPTKNNLGTTALQTIAEGARFLQRAKDIKEHWDATVEKAMVLAEEELKGKDYKRAILKIKNEVPRHTYIDYINLANSCESYLQTLHSNGFKKTRIKNDDEWNGFIGEGEHQNSELYLNYGIDPSIIELVEYAHGYNGNEDPLAGMANCIRPSIHTVAVHGLKLFKASLECISPLGRVITFESGYKLKFAPFILLQVGETADSDPISAPIPIHDLNEDFRNKYYFMEKVSLGFGELYLVKDGKKNQKGDNNRQDDLLPAGDVKFNDGLEDEVNKDSRFKTWEKIKIRGRRFGGLGFMGFGNMKLRVKLKEATSDFAPMNESLAKFVQEHGNIPRQLGFDHYWWAPEKEVEKQE